MTRFFGQGREAQASTVTQPHRVPLATPLSTRDETFEKDARLVNAIAELDPVTKEFWVEKRLGLLLYRQHTGVGLGVYNWQGHFFAIFGTKVYKNGLEFGTIGDTSSVYVFTEMLGTYPNSSRSWLVFNNGKKAYYTDGTTLWEFEAYSSVKAGALAVGSTYAIVVAGNTDFVAAGAANNNVGTQFVATGLGDPLTTGEVALGAVSLLPGVLYKIQSLGTTNFTLVGAAANTVGTIFTANEVAGLGTGTVYIPNFPATFVKGWAYLDGTLYVMDVNARIYGTSSLAYGGIGGFDDPRVWDPLNMIVARSEPDRGVSIRKHLNYVMAFKQWTVEPFYDAKNPTGSPLSPVQGALCVYGCVSADSIQDIDGTLLWVTANKSVSPQIARMDSLRAEIISTPPVERLLDQIDFSQTHSWALKHAGHRFYGVTFVVANITLVYDLDQGLWYQWTDINGDYWPMVARSYSFNNKHVMQHKSNGKLYYAEGDYEFPTDDGDIVPVDIYTPSFDGGIDRRKTLTVMRFNCDKKVDSKLLVRCSDNDYESWTNFREVDLSKNRPILTNCGTFYRRAWNFRHEEATPLRIRSIDLQMDIGTL